MNYVPVGCLNFRDIFRYNGSSRVGDGRRRGAGSRVVVARPSSFAVAVFVRRESVLGEIVQVADAKITLVVRLPGKRQ